jgi:uncharacterized protein
MTTEKKIITKKDAVRPKNLVENRLTDLQTQIAASKNFQTANANIEAHPPQITLEYPNLENYYNSFNIIQTAIDLPVDDALSKGFDVIADELDADDIQQAMDTFHEFIGLDNIGKLAKYSRLYGGSGLILLDGNQDLTTTPVITPKSKLSCLVVDRWRINTKQIGLGDTITKDLTLEYNSNVKNFWLHVFNDVSRECSFERLTPFKNKNTLDRTSWLYLRGWGASIVEQILEVLNRHIKARNVIYEILDEAKISILNIEGYREQLITSDGTANMAKLAQLTNQIKDYSSLMMLDGKDKFDQKQLNFAGLAEMLREIRLDMAAALRMPMSKLYGEQQAGWATKQHENDNYNSYLRSVVQNPLKPVIKQVMTACFQKAGLSVPTWFDIKFPQLAEINEQEAEAIKQSTYTRLSDLYANEVLDDEEFKSELSKAGILQLD